MHRSDTTGDTATGMRQRPETHSDLNADFVMDVAGVIWLTVFGLVIGTAKIVV